MCSIRIRTSHMWSSRRSTPITGAMRANRCLYYGKKALLPTRSNGMKTGIKIIIVIAGISGFLPGVRAQQSDTMETGNKEQAAITQALEEYYFKGLYEGDTA